MNDRSTPFELPSARLHALPPDETLALHFSTKDDIKRAIGIAIEKNIPFDVAGSRDIIIPKVFRRFFEEIEYDVRRVRARSEASSERLAELRAKQWGS